MTTEPPVLVVEDLAIHFPGPQGVARVVDGASLTVGRGEIVGIAGESGCGKTTLVEAVMQIIRFPNRIARGRVLFTPREGRTIDLMQLPEPAMRRLRGERLAYVPQGSMNALNPVLRIADQLIDTMVTHGVPRREAARRGPELLERVGLEPQVGRAYPHELSGGMKQRCIIAIAIALAPDLIVADEPTTALDVNVQRRILETLARLREELGMAILIVSHDLPVHAELTDRVGIMYAGQIVEAADIRAVVKTPLHPYAHGLIAAIPAIGGERKRLAGIPGSPPSPREWPTGCRFNPRCPAAMPVCQEVAPVLVPLTADERTITLTPTPRSRTVACHRYPQPAGSAAR